MVYMYHSFLIHSSADGHLGCFLIFLKYVELNVKLVIKLNFVHGGGKKSIEPVLFTSTDKNYCVFLSGISIISTVYQVRKYLTKNH